MKCYKLVHGDGTPVYYSYVLREYHQLRLEYVIGTKTTAKVGGVLCFKRLTDAILFSSCRYPCVLVCEGEGKLKLPKYRLSSFPFLPGRGLDVIRLCWRYPDQRATVDTWLGWPKGTVAYRSVTPISVVPKSRIDTFYSKERSR